MVTKSCKAALALLVLIGSSGIAAMILLADAKVAWNSGARERLGKALRTIGKHLAAIDNGQSVQQLDPRDFIAQSAEQRRGPSPGMSDRLAKRHGITVRWYRNGTSQEVFFYPIAISPEIAIKPRSNAKPRPQIVMVPVEEADRKLLPNLHGCENTTAERLRECQLRRMKRLFSTLGMDDAATLMSDGSVVYMPVDDLWTDSDLNP